jgi:hypothetical protein
VLHVLEVLGSNLDPETNNPDLGFSLVPQGSAGMVSFPTYYTSIILSFEAI